MAMPIHTHFVLMAMIFPGEPGLAGCLFNSPSPFIPVARFTKDLKIILQHVKSPKLRQIYDKFKTILRLS